MAPQLDHFRHLYKRANCAITDLAFIILWMAIFSLIVFQLDINFPAPIIVFVAYVLPLLISAISGAGSGQTLGMRSERLIFAGAEGGELSFIRCFLRILLGFALVPLLPLSLVMILTNPKHISLADWLSRTRMKEMLHVPVHGWLPRDTAITLLVRHPVKFTTVYWWPLIILFLGATSDCFTTLKNIRTYGAAVEVHVVQRWVQQRLGAAAGVPIAKAVQLVFVLFIASWWRPWCRWILLLCGLLYMLAAVSNHWLLL